MSAPRRTYLLAAALVLTGCSQGPAAQTPPPPAGATTTGADPASQAATQTSTAGSSVPSAAGAGSAAVTPAPSTAGDLDAAVFPQRIARFRAVPGEGDEGTYQPNGSWVHALDPAETAANLQRQACGPARRLPVPRHVLASDYEDETGARAVGQALRFGSDTAAQDFLASYAANVRTCTSATNPFSVRILSSGNPFVDRRVALADGTRWVEVATRRGTLVRLFIAAEQDRPLTGAELAAARRALG